jgi:hypothetical protein
MSTAHTLRACLCALLCAAAAAAGEGYEERFLALREQGDRIRIEEARGHDTKVLRAAYAREHAAFVALQPATGEDVARVSARVREGALELPELAEGARGEVLDCASVAAPRGDFRALRRHLYACFSRAATAIPFEGTKLDRLVLLDELARSNDAARRETLFRALAPLYRSIDGDGGRDSPYRALQALVAAAWAQQGSPIESNLSALGIEPALLEPWLVAILEAWRDGFARDVIEPWDYEYLGSPVERRLGALASRERFESINADYHASLGADPVALNIHYDLAPRPGKTAVAFTDFGARPQRRADGTWSSGEPWVFASYTRGGIGNLTELLHETGHAIHIAAIRTRPADADWPDSNALTEAIAELLSQEIYEADWQRRWLGEAAPLAENLRSRYSNIVLDVAWGLFELRVFRDPALEPNAVWSEITQRYLGIRPHPELSWWARRGQLVSNPGYMMNYAIGAILAADLRARSRELRGAPAGADYYAWLSERLLRFGLEKASAGVLRDFLGRSPDPRALLADMRRAPEVKPVQ